jgi:hypothetical protein
MRIEKKNEITRINNWNCYLFNDFLHLKSINKIKERTYKSDIFEDEVKVINIQKKKQQKVKDRFPFKADRKENNLSIKSTNLSWILFNLSCCLSC